MTAAKKLILSLMAAIFALVAFIFFQTGGGAENRTAVSALSDNSSVIKDLTADKNFNVSDYPEISDDYSIKVVQIAESQKGYLYVYTYQPCNNTKKLTATDINMSLSKITDDTKLYELIEVNSWGVFSKYLVRDVKVSTTATRYYNISSIYRTWDKDIDGELENNNTGGKKAYAVANVYKVQDVNGEKVYACEPAYVINIIEPYSDFLLYTSSSSLPAISSIKNSYEKLGFIDAHYIAFSTDIEIDRLKSATVTYSARAASGEVDKFLFFPEDGKTTYGTEEVYYAYPTYLDKAEFTGSIWTTGRKYKYDWDRIQTVSEFISTEQGLTEETKSNLAGKQWVLRFTETQRTQTERTILGYKTITVDWTDVKKVAVLRLEFETDGKVYNLGAVSDMISGDGSPGNVEPKPEKESFWDKVGKFFEKLWNNIKGLKWWHWLLIALGVIAGIALIISIVSFGIKAVFKFIFWLIGKLIQGLWWLVTLPFRAIGGAIKNHKEKKK